MKKIRKEKVESEVLDDVLCNQCGQGMIGHIGKLRGNICGLMSQVSGGFDSSGLEDGVTYKFDLCEKCLVDLFSTFTIPVEKEDYL